MDKNNEENGKGKQYSLSLKQNYEKDVGGNNGE